MDLKVTFDKHVNNDALFNAIRLVNKLNGVERMEDNPDDHREFIVQINDTVNPSVIENISTSPHVYKVEQIPSSP